MKPQSNNSKTNILIIIIGIMAAYNIFQTKNIKTDVSEYNKKIDLIQNGIDSVYALNEKITEQIVAINDEIDKVDNDINGVTKNITIIKNQTNEKVDAVNEFTFSDLYKFFSDRYESRTDTTRHDSGVESSDRKVSN
jgi:predicted  nucleic acid-binding Zn-ribbon protein